MVEVLILIIVSLAYRFSFKHSNFSKSRLMVFCVFLQIFTVLTLLSIRDLDDEAYIWISKFKNLFLHGKFGIQIDNSRFGESSAGAIQYLISGLVWKISKITPEQSLTITSIFISSGFFIVIYFLLLHKRLIPRLGLLSYIILAFSPSFILNTSHAMDNLGGGLALWFWLLARNNSYDGRHKKFRLVISGFSPLIRFELVILPLVDLVKLVLTREEKFQTKIIQTFYLVGPMFLYSCYRYWAFQDLIPAMVQLKGFQFNPILFQSGVEYFNQVFSYSVVLVLFSIILLVLKTGLNSYSIKSNFDLFLISSFLLFTPVITGGDYYGAIYARYYIEFLLFTYLILILGVSKFSAEPLRLLKRKVRWVNFLQIQSMNSFFILVFLSPWHFSDFEKNLLQTHYGRVTCDQSVASLVFSVIPNARSVATSEIFSFNYVTGMTLIDLMGGADTKNFPAKSDPWPSDPMHIRFDFKDKIFVSKPDLIWAYGSAACPLYAHFPSNEVYSLAEKEKYREAFDFIYNSERELWRIGSPDSLNKSYNKVVISFREISDSKYESNVIDGNLFAIIYLKKGIEIQTRPLATSGHDISVFYLNTKSS